MNDEKLHRIVHPNRGMLYFLAISIAILLGVYYAAQLYVIDEEARDVEASFINAQSVKNTDALREENIQNWKTYRNEQYGFEFKYPKDIKVFDCTDTMTGSYVYFRMRYVNDNYDWCNAPGKAVPHSIYMELSQFMTRNDLTQTISRIENKSLELKKDIRNDSIYLEYTFNEKDDEGNVIEPKINIVNKRAFIMVQNDLYVSIGLIYKEKEIDAELKQKYEFAINQIFESFVKID